jgi:hypothetical protein
VTGSNGGNHRSDGLKVCEVPVGAVDHHVFQDCKSGDNSEQTAKGK